MDYFKGSIFHFMHNKPEVKQKIQIFLFGNC